MTITKNIPIGHTTEFLRQLNNLKVLKGIFWFTRTLAIISIGLAILTKYIPYPSIYVTNIALGTLLFGGIIIFSISLICNIMLTRMSKNIAFIGSMVLGMKVYQLLGLAKNEINSKRKWRRKLAIYALPTMPNDTVVDVLSDLEEIETGKMKQIIQNTLKQVEEKLTTANRQIIERKPYQDFNGNYVNLYPKKFRSMARPIL